jgi:hypothetical protein
LVNIKENLWAIVIIAGILGIVSIFTPTLYIDIDDASIWVWNLYVSSAITDFIQTDEPIFGIGIIATIVIVIGTIITLFSGIISKVRDKNLTLLSLLGGIVLLIGPIIYLAGIGVVDETFWEYATVSVGSILPFIAGAIAILGALLDKLGRKS